MTTTVTDAVLVRRVLDGDSSAFAALFDRHAAAVHSYALRRLHDEGLAEEVVSNTFLEAWRSGDRLAAVEENVRPWLFGIARNHVRRQWRTERRKRAAYMRVAAIAATQTVDHADSFTHQNAITERLGRVLSALDHLDEQDHELLTLSVWEGMTYQELAETLAMPIGTVRSKLSRARAKLAQATGGRYE